MEDSHNAQASAAQQTRKPATTAISIPTNVSRHATTPTRRTPTRGLGGDVMAEVGFDGLPFSIPKNKLFARASPLLSSPVHSSPLLPSPLFSSGIPSGLLNPGIFSNEPMMEGGAGAEDVGFTLDEGPAPAAVVPPATAFTMRLRQEKQQQQQQQQLQQQAQLPQPTLVTVTLDASMPVVKPVSEPPHAAKRMVAPRCACSSTRSALRSGFLLSSQFLEPFFLHLFACALTAYRWAMPAVPGMLAFIACAALLVARRRQMAAPAVSVFSRFGVTSVLAIAALEGVGTFLIGTSVASLPLTCTLLMRPAAESVTFITTSIDTHTDGKTSFVRRLNFAQLAIIIAFLASLANGFTNNALPDMWTQAISPQLAHTAQNGTSVTAATAFFTVGFIAYCASAWLRDRAVLTTLQRAIDDDFFAHERERAAKEKSKAEGTDKGAVSHNKSKKTSSLTLQGKVANVDIDEPQLKLTVSLLASSLLLLLSAASASFIQGVVSNDTMLPMGTGTIAGNATTHDFVWRLHHGMVCAFAGGSDADGAKIGDGADVSGTTVTYHNYCSLALPSLGLFVIFGILARVLQAVPVGSGRSKFYEAYGVQDATQSDAKASSKHEDWLTRSLRNKFSVFPVLYFLCMLVTIANPVSQQASPTFLQAAVVTDMIAIAVLVIAAVLEGQRRPFVPLPGARPSRWPLPYSVSSTGQGYILVGGVTEYSLGESGKDDAE